MYGDYKGYPQEYETWYTEDHEGDNQYYYDYNPQPSMMMNHPRNNQSLSQFRNQNFMGYPMANNQHFTPNIPSSYNPKPVIYPLQQRPQPRNDIFQQSPPSSQYSAHRQPQISSPYTFQQASNQYVPKQTHEKLSKQYEITLKMFKSQNIKIMEKLKLQIRKTQEQYTMVRDWILSANPTDLNEDRQEKLIENFKGMNTEYLHQNVHEEDKQPDQQLDYLHQDLEPAQHSLVQSNIVPDLNVEAKIQFVSKKSPYALMLEKKILNLKQKKANEKANEDIKHQNISRSNEYHKVLPSQKFQKDHFSQVDNKLKKSNIFVKQKLLQKQQHYEDQDNLDPEQPMYPDDHQGEQSFLVDEQVEEKQRIKSLKDHPKAKTFGIQSPETDNFQFRPRYQNQDYEKEQNAIKQFFDEFLCEQLVYPLKEEFMKYRISKMEIYRIYVWWRKKKSPQFKFLLGQNIIRRKITLEMHKRFTSISDHNDNYIGIMFRDINIFKKMKIPQEVNL